MQNGMLIILSMVSFLAGTIRASDCCAAWALPALEGVSPITLADAGATFKSIDPNFKYVLTSSRICTNPRVDGSEFYNLTIFGHVIGSVEVGNDQFKGNRLLAYLPITKLSEDRLVAVEEASKALNADIKDIEESLGLQFYSPRAVPIYNRCPSSTLQLLYMGMETHRDGGGYSSLDLISKDFKVKISEFVPEREDYSDAILYKKGDLQAAFCNDRVLFEKCQEIAKHNTRNISHSLEGHAKPSSFTNEKQLEKWKKIVESYGKLDQLKQ